MTIIAVDPGDTTGVAVWNEDYDLVDMKQILMENISQFWQETQEKHGPITTVIVEDFVLFAHRAVKQAGSRMKAPKGIGAFEALAGLVGAKFVLQRADIKKIALKWSKIKLPSEHKYTHEYDAYLHGYYYLVKEGKIKTQLQLEKERERAEEA